MAQITLNSTGVASSGALALQSNGTTTAVTIDTSQNVGIGETSPTTKLDVKAAQGRIKLTSSTGTNNALFLFNNTGGNAYVGLDSSVGSLTAAYALNLYHEGAYPITFSTNSAERARIDSSGNLLVGTTSGADGRIKVDGTGNATNCAVWAKNSAGATSGTYVCWNAATTGNNQFIDFYTETSATIRGSISYNRAGGLTAYNTTSDYRAKDIYGPVTGSGALIDSVPVYMGKMKGATQERPMFIAHETPEYAHTGEKDAVDADGNPVYQQMDASALVPVMWAEIQLLRARMAASEALITTLTDRITALEAK